MNLLLINSDDGPDYLADLINYFFITNKYKINTNHKLNFLFNDYQDLNTLYGKGFTLYGKINHELKKNITELSIQNIYEDINSFDLIIFTSIQRNFKGQSLKKEVFNKIFKNAHHNNIVVIDGEDIDNIDKDIATKVKYFKRELNEKDSNLAFPISFTFPAKELMKNNIEILEKVQLLAPMDPRFNNSYIYNDEVSYFQQYSSSVFATTIKKAGWDCMRHYEILSQNTLLFFPGIQDKPKYVMNSFPVNLQIEINKLFSKIILKSTNIDSLEEIRLNYPSKNFLSNSTKKVKRKLSKLNITENNLNEIKKLNKEMQEWFQLNGTSNVYKNILEI